MKRAAFALQANRARLTERFVKKEKAQPEEEDEPVEEYDPVRNPAVVLEPHEVRTRATPPRSSAFFTPAPPRFRQVSRTQLLRELLRGDCSEWERGRAMFERMLAAGEARIEHANLVLRASGDSVAAWEVLRAAKAAGLAPDEKTYRLLVAQ